MDIIINWGNVHIGEESICITQEEGGQTSEIYLTHKELETIYEKYKSFKSQMSVDKSVKDYLEQPNLQRLINKSKRKNPDAPGNVSFLWD